MTPAQQSFLAPIARGCLEWEASTTLPFKRIISTLTVCQAPLENGWTGSVLSRPPVNNWGGVKHHLPEWPGYSTATREVIQGQNQIVKGAFQTYPTVTDYVADHAKVLLDWACVRNSLGIGLQAACDALGPWTEADRQNVKDGHPELSQHSNYSTDPTYGPTLFRIAVECGLTDTTALERLAGEAGAG